MKTITLLALHLAILNGALLSAQAQGTAFTYQGRLNDNGSPASGSYDLLLTIYDSAGNPGTVIAGPLTNSATAVTEGLFTTTIDFGTAVFSGPPRWLEIGVRTNGGSAFTTLSPRQALTATPYAFLAGDVTGTNIARLDTPNTATTATGVPSITSGFVTGATVTKGGSGYASAPAVTVNDATGSGAVITATVSNGAVASLTVQNAGHSYSPAATLLIGSPPSNAYQVFPGVNYFTGISAFSSSNNSFAGRFSGSGTNLTGVNAATLGGLGAGQFWQLGGNAGTTPTVNFLGTTDNQALLLRANGMRVLRLEPDSRGAYAGNLIGGYTNNVIEQPGSGGDVIGGGGFVGGPNMIHSNSSGVFIGAGYGNQIGPNVNDSVIGGGSGNAIQAFDAVIGGGAQNTIRIGAYDSTIGGGFQNTVQINSQNATIGGGRQNIASGEGAAVGGGESNGSTANYATISGGWFNFSGGVFAAVGGGFQNFSADYAATVGGGFQNTNSGQYATVGGGYQNTIQSGGNFSTIGAGKNNTIEANADFDVIGGGYGNRIDARFANIGGGESNAIETDSQSSVISGGAYNLIQNGTGDSTIGGGYLNVIQTNAASSFIGGGDGNTIQTNAYVSTIGGGGQNTIRLGATFSTIGGGGNNVCVTNGGTVGGGGNNLSGGFYSTVGGGYQNSASNFYATVAGGENNTVTAGDAFIGGGFHNLGGGGFATASGGANNTASGKSATVAGGENNTSSGDWSAVPGGYNNMASGPYSFAAGRNALAPGSGSFVWNSYANPNYAVKDDYFSVFAPNGFSVDYYTQRPDGGGSRWVYIGEGTSGGFPSLPTTILTWNGAYLSDGGVWTSSSDRARKENFAPVDARSVLERVAALPIQTWNFTNEPPALRHLGPMAQDFQAAFGLNGGDDKHIADVDEGGVALAAIQGLNQKLEEKEGEIRELKQRLDKLERLLHQTAAGDH